jgi:hypothetical protein
MDYGSCSQGQRNAVPRLVFLNQLNRGIVLQRPCGACSHLAATKRQATTSQTTNDSKYYGFCFSICFGNAISNAIRYTIRNVECNSNADLLADRYLKV